MEIIQFFLMLALLISCFSLRKRLIKIESLLETRNLKELADELVRAEQKESQDLSTQPEPEKAPLKETIAVHPPPMNIPEPEIKTEPESPQPCQPKEPTALANFITWLWMGNQKGKENVSKEYAVATTWLMRAGVLILLCGIGFFLKYSIENNLISPPIRVALTYLVGLAMFISGIVMVNKRFHILAVGILSAGIITLYMGSFAGYKLYHILPAGAAFGFMVLTTVAAMLVSLKRNLLPTALTGCTGAYLTPVLLSDGSGNIPFLLGYTAMVSLGILIISRERRWRSLEITAFAFSFILMSAGILNGRIHEKINWLCPAAVFVNYLVFSSIPVLRKKEFFSGKLEWVLPLFSTMFALGLGLTSLEALSTGSMEKILMTGYAILISAVSLLEGIWLSKKQPEGAKMLPAFLCASTFSLALAAPLALENMATIYTAWSLLGFVLVLASERSRLKTLLVLSLLTFLFAGIGTFQFLHDFSPFADRFFSGGVLALSLLGAGVVLRKNSCPAQGSMTRGYNTIFWEFKAFYYAVGGLAFLGYTTWEIYHYLECSKSLNHFRHGGVSVWWGLLAVGLIVYGIRKNLKPVRISALILSLVCVFKIYCVDISGLNTLWKVIAFLVLGVLFLGAATAYILFRKRFSQGDNT